MYILLLLVLVVVGYLIWATGRPGYPGHRVTQGRAPPETLERIEGALSALESRVAALEDQQRFLERLLAERPEGQDRSLPPGEDGPAEHNGPVLLDDSSDDVEDR